MKYTVNTQAKTINIESQMSAEELKGLCEQYPDYSFSGNNYVPYYPTQPYYPNAPITFCGDTATITTNASGTFTIHDGNTSATNLIGVAKNGSTDTTLGFAGKTTLNN